jgi:hypothetical protein
LPGKCVMLLPSFSWRFNVVFHILKIYHPCFWEMKKMHVLLHTNFIVVRHCEGNVYYLVLAMLISHTILYKASVQRNQTQKCCSFAFCFV